MVPLESEPFPDAASYDDETSPPLPPGTIETPRGRSLGIWALALINVVCAALVVLGILFLAGAQSYAVTDSVEFGSDLAAIIAGIWILRVSGYVMLGGFLLSALGVLSMSRLGWRIQTLWAVVLCLTVVGLAYGVPVLVFLRREPTRSRFFPAPDLI